MPREPGHDLVDRLATVSKKREFLDLILAAKIRQFSARDVDLWPVHA
jgi:hypothetical protein